MEKRIAPKLRAYTRPYLRARTTSGHWHRPALRSLFTRRNPVDAADHELRRRPGARHRTGEAARTRYDLRTNATRKSRRSLQSNHQAMSLYAGPPQTANDMRRALLEVTTETILTTREAERRRRLRRRKRSGVCRRAKLADEERLRREAEEERRMESERQAAEAQSKRAKRATTPVDRDGSTAAAANLVAPAPPAASAPADSSDEATISNPGPRPRQPLPSMRDSASCGSPCAGDRHA
jgi:hypothetical protein